MNLDRHACIWRPRSVGFLTTLAALTTWLALAARAHATECHDVRTGQDFNVPTARYSSAGAPIEDAPLLGRLCVGALRATYAVPISDGAGGAYVVWIESAAEDCDLRVQRVVGSGEPAMGWPEGGRMLCTARGTQSQPVLALAGDAGLWVAWKDFRDPQRSSIYVSLLDATGTPVTGYVEGGILASSVAAPASDPILIGDDFGGAWLLWQQGRPGSRGIWLKRFSADGALVPGWPTEGRLLATGSTDVTHPLACGDGLGGFVLAWVVGAGGGSTLRVTRFDAGATPVAGWSGAGLELGSSSAHLLPAAMVADSMGAFVAWVENFEDSSSARLSRVGLNGAVSSGWTSGGRRLSDAGTATSPALALDDSGGAYVAWQGRDGGSGDVGVKLVRLAASGESCSGWTAEGLALPNTGVGSYRPRLLALEDGVLASWSESGSRSEGVVLSAAVASLGALPELEKVEAWPDLAKLTWRVAGEASYAAFVERHGGDNSWVPLRELVRNAQGNLVLEDHEVVPGDALTYRLRLRSSQMELVIGEVSLVVPAAAPLAILRLAVEDGRLRMVGSVPNRSESKFEIFDVQGRRLLRDVRQHDHAGEVTLDLNVPTGMRAGVFFARFSQGREVKTRRFVVWR